MVFPRLRKSEEAEEKSSEIFCTDVLQTTAAISFMCLSGENALEHTFFGFGECQWANVCLLTPWVNDQGASREAMYFELAVKHDNNL